ncbi:hypothetical protein mRhiFer1_010043 [Rhinolophus ferrumequinum]|uniref:Uncharacterized protein n=1 Tax=Rhinolophus ferrumequinum TaxID=59479 RepID=A0A7J7Y595_RHIFE|nr:hypothetical protein mRhiFer1_010043 [Rhinolophus ferrumequinum]
MKEDNQKVAASTKMLCRYGMQQAMGKGRKRAWLSSTCSWPCGTPQTTKDTVQLRGMPQPQMHSCHIPFTLATRIPPTCSRILQLVLFCLLMRQPADSKYFLIKDLSSQAECYLTNVLDSFPLTLSHTSIFFTHPSLHNLLYIPSCPEEDCLRVDSLSP